MEEALSGGNVNAVVRVGDTVLREAGPWTPTVHRFLLHLRGSGIGGIPVPLGLAEDGREVLSFVLGTVPAYPMPGWVWEESVLVDAARLLRRVHDASLRFSQRGGVWQQPAREPAEVICHNDFSPHNLVFDGGALVGAIDFDQCSPGPRVWDLAYLATRLVPLTAGGSSGGASWNDLLDRVATLLGAYGTDLPVPELLRVAHLRLLELADFSRAKAVELAKPELREHATHYLREAAWLEEQVQAAG